MINQDFIFSSESVTEGHPDKVADQISDAVLDAIIKDDPSCRVACETLITRNKVILSAEIKSTVSVDYKKIVKDTLLAIGYNEDSTGFNANTCDIDLYIEEQSPDISMGVDQKGTGIIGAGDQGLMFGYATNENDNLMPYPILLAHKLTKDLALKRKDGSLPFLMPDGKSQVSIKYEDNKAKYVDTVLISTQHSENVDDSTLKESIIEEIIKKQIPYDLINSKTKFLINPTGRFVVGGPQGDTGLTGRKIIVDTYGGWAKHGGGAFSGKDPSKVDRSACYMARYLAKNIVASGLLPDCEIQLAYAIGKAEPVSFNLTSTLNINSEILNKLSSKLFEIFDCTPKGIIDTLDLLNPIYQNTASYGHFGRDEKGFNWENTDKKEEIKSL
ncbi:methionine adenosyltransferase [bacterium]|jgi:S-adenosylmethionine synthetase|nr:methionine adenosyltransferase [bacterium]MBT3850475.1 methionine adenosyltransferase [bacterium]MBT4434941.1 methionine adenosyltransferase [bacterium]MDG2445898.1 methionine adenosyltransferase [Thermodesulfobacteriota bacterium]|tara:strand:+ start:303 stop:1460 length:1158 start_codon:yes stop_codon:yes gene_type:complete